MEEILKAIFGGIFITFLPGFLLSYVFFSFHTGQGRPKKEISWPVRIFLSFFLTIIFLPLFVYFASLLGMKLNFINIFIASLIIIAFSIIFVFIRKKYEH